MTAIALVASHLWLRLDDVVLCVITSDFMSSTTAEEDGEEQSERKRTTSDDDASLDSDVCRRTNDDDDDAVDDRMVWFVWLSQHYLPATGAAMSFGVFETLKREGRVSEETLAKETKLGKRGIRALMNVLRACGFVRRRRGSIKEKEAEITWSLSSSGSRFLTADSPWNWRAMLEGSASGLTEKLISILEIDAYGGGVGQAWETGQLTEPQAEIMTRQFHSHSVNAARAFASALVQHGIQPCSATTSTKSAPTMLDVAGGSGCFSVHVAVRCAVRCTVMELPVVLPEARVQMETLIAALVPDKTTQAQIKARVRCVEGSMWHTTDKWPRTVSKGLFDAILFSNIFHDWSLWMCSQLARSAIQVVRPGGRIFVHEILLEEDNHDKDADHRQEDAIAALLSLHMLLYSSEGAQQSGPCWSGLLRDAGFVNVEVCRSGSGPFSIVTGVRPSRSSSSPPSSTTARCVSHSENK